MKLTDKDNETILACPHAEMSVDPHLFTLQEDESKAIILWLCKGCFDKIGVKWLEEILTLRVRTI